MTTTSPPGLTPAKEELLKLEQEGREEGQEEEEGSENSDEHYETLDQETVDADLDLD